MSSTSTRSRRQYGSHSIYQRSVDGRWFAAIQCGWTSRGTRRTVTVSAKTEQEVKRKLAKKVREIARGELPAEGASSRTTVKAWAETWLEVMSHSWSPNAHSSGAGLVNKWVVTTIGHKRLEALTPADIRAVAKAQLDAGKATSTAAKTQQILVQMLKAAMLEGHAVPPRVLMVPRPSINANDRMALKPAEAVVMLSEAAAILPHYSRWWTALLHAMRQGECLGLTWDDIDLEAGTMTVRWSLTSLPYKDPRHKALGFRVPDDHVSRQLVGALHLVRPKSKAGSRVVPLIPEMQAALAAWREICPPSPYGLVWPAADGGPANDKDDRAEFVALQGSAGIGHPSGDRAYTTHECRHTTATLLMALGVDPTVRIQIMGHSNITTTRGYEHVSVDEARKALAKVGTLLNLTSPSR